jgi:hypothetical protein
MTGNISNRLPPRRRPKRRRNRQLNAPIPLPSSLMYTGPISVPSTDMTTVILIDNGAVTGTVVTISSIYNNNPSSARNWTEYSTSWNEYRVLGMKFTYDPLTTAPNASITQGSGYHSVFHGTATAPTSLAEAASTGVARPFNVFKPFTREWRMSNVNESTFIQTSAPASTSDTLVLYSNNTVATTVGNIKIEYLVQFKTHVK